MDILKDNIVLIAVAVLYLLSGMRGWHKGFIKMIASLVSVVLAVIIAKTLMPKATELMMQSNSWINWVEASVLPHMAGASLKLVLSIISFAAIFVLSLILIKILLATLDKIFDLPILNFINSAGGMLFALAETTVYVWVAMMIVNVTPAFPISRMIIDQVNKSYSLSMLRDNNLLLQFLQKLI